MRKIIASLLLILTIGCAGYKPIFSSKNFDFFIAEIKIPNDDKISTRLGKKLQSYMSKDDVKKAYSLKIISNKEEKIVSRDTKGDPLIYELKVVSNIEVIHENNRTTKLDFSEKFTFNNDSNKFALSQYRKTIEQNLINNIYEKLIIRMQTL